MVQVFADDALIYTPNLEGYELLGLTATVSVEKAGTAEITLPASHPAYEAFISHRTVVTIRRAGDLIFRGRSLAPADDIFGRRKITCEGERCFLRDAVIQPYLYQADPAVIFADVIGKYNAQVDEFKRFKVGAITVKDPNGYIRLESEQAVLASEVVDKLVERVGGYIMFSEAADGQRVINWYGRLDRVSGQTVELGENLLDFSRSGSNDDFATVIYPYGAKDETTGERLTIAAVNGGKLYVEDEAAVARHGRVAVPLMWDDVTLASNLKAKALQELDVRKLIVTTLELSAVDLSAQDVNIDAFRIGDNVPVLSKPHGVDDLFLLSTRTYDLLNPGNDKITLGKETTTLTRASVASDKVITSQAQQAGKQIVNTYNIYSGEGGGGSEGSDYELPAASETVLGGVMVGPGLTVNADGRLGINGEVYEVVEVLKGAVSYSKNATFNLLHPVDTTAIYFGYLDYVGTQFAIARKSNSTSDVLLRLLNAAIPTVSAQNICENAVVLTFASEGVTECELTYTARYTLRDTGVITPSVPTSFTIGPLYMMRKIKEE